jgi:hypothetical protein
MAPASKPGALSALIAACWLAVGCENTVAGETPADVTGGSGSSSSGTGGATAGSGHSGGSSAGPSGGTSGSSATGGAGGSAGTGAPPPLVLDSGRVVLRRLNRSEYNNTVRDLLGTSLRPADQLPNDVTVDGYDTVGEGLSLTLQHFEVLEQGATALVDELFSLPASDARRQTVLVCEPSASAEPCTRQILSGFAGRAFRRPVDEPEVARLLSLLAQAQQAGNSFQDSLKAALRAVLLSPHFLFMVERTSGTGDTAFPVDDRALATRLSYFLWSSMPDAELSGLAAAGTLTRDASALAGAVERMLSDPKASELTHNFAGQWLPLRRLSLVEPDPRTFPNYRVELRDASVGETERFFRALVDENAPVETLLTADFTFVNSALAQHYGIPASGADFQRVSLADSGRAGILGQMSVLAATSHPSQTSPTKRGAWVLEQLLCSPPNPPPADLMIDPLGEPDPGQTLRQRVEAHRANDLCAGCHAIMDPIGFGLENFDAVGAHRTTDNGLPIDASGTLEDVPFSGAQELATLLASDARFAGCASRQLLTYAVGRSFDTPDGHAYAEALAAHARAEGRRGLEDLVLTVAQSEAFRTRRGE